MFQKEKIRKLECQIDELKEENERLERCVNSWQREHAKLKEDLEYEHLENHKNHQALLAIKKIVNEPYGTFESLIKIAKGVKKELANARNID